MTRPTQDEYTAKANTNGDYCPHCGHDQPQGDGYEWSLETLREMLWCPLCGATFAAEYKRTGYAITAE